MDARSSGADMSSHVAATQLDIDGTVIDVPGTTLLLATLGSTAYGLATEGSDRDRVGVFLADPSDVLGLRALAAVQHTVVHSSPDVAIHELGKFCSLALKANPTVLELLFCGNYEVATDAGSALVELAPAFLSTAAVSSAYGGYVRAQLARLGRRIEAATAPDEETGRRRTAKLARHTMRLLLTGGELLVTGTMNVDVGAHREELFANGELAVSNPRAFFALAEAALERFDRLDSVLPDVPDRERVDRFLVRCRLDAIASAQV